MYIKWPLYGFILEHDLCRPLFVLFFIFGIKPACLENQTLEFELGLATPMVCTSFTSFLTALS